ncbi:Indole-3-glycerol phosphate synthase [Chitinispirillum alkaliphilum]|nr:Indole-3-glycerol phosphate synthase [Chitinispirillum alkaliphilum]
MNEVLTRILEEKKTEVRMLRDRRSGFNGRSDTKRGFVECFNKTDRLSLIAEVKKASPSKGVIREDFDPVQIALNYEKYGADAVSVLTDEKFFQGHEEFLISVRENISLPVLRKDFIIDTLQVEHTAAINADAMLLIAAALGDSQLKDLYQAAVECELDPLIEIHSLEELERAMKLQPPVIGINNRDLNSFKTDISVTLEIVKNIPSDIPVISESGIHSEEQACKLMEAGVRGLLVGESLMRCNDPRDLMTKLSSGKAGV